MRTNDESLHSPQREVSINGQQVALIVIIGIELTRFNVFPTFSLSQTRMVFLFI